MDQLAAIRWIINEGCTFARTGNVITIRHPSGDAVQFDPDPTERDIVGRYIIPCIQQLQKGLLQQWPRLQDIANNQFPSQKDRLIMQCITTLSGLGKYANMTVQDVYNEQIRLASD